VDLVIERLTDEDTFFWVIMGGVALAAIVFGTITSMFKSMARERTRREIAAYIAEGSMTPEQGERLMKARARDQCP